MNIFGCNLTAAKEKLAKGVSATQAEQRKTFEGKSRQVRRQLGRPKARCFPRHKKRLRDGKMIAANVRSAIASSKTNLVRYQSRNITSLTRSKLVLHQTPVPFVITHTFLDLGLSRSETVVRSILHVSRKVLRG